MTDRFNYPQKHIVSAGTSSIWVGEQPGEEPAIVLLHGFPDDATIYDKLVPFLEGRRVVAIDFGGYGLSPRDDEPWSEGRPEAELVAVLEELAITGATLVGHDASVPVAVNVTLDHPDRVAKLVLLNGYFDSDPELKLPDMIRLFGTPELSLLSDAIMNDQQLRGWLLGFSGKQFGIDPSGADSVAEHSILPQYYGSENQPDARVAIRKWTATLYPGLAQNDARVRAGDLGRLTTPVVVAFGEGDPYLTPTIAAHIGALFPSAVVEGIGQSSHWPQWDQPEVVASKVL
ncbi:alpha/beta fold hydrolase [Subtercola endophyticus]|uniref:alpha/beta fold hydrolase n=1 Tax=Subtercola endophyticus TaxID=2895559 RepID=UPI001E5D4561|nr:alpha/beta hydrolase [Subtercola endophyticus]UFS60590.1 alpha/beta hydrolase [Subtercola endophyticus]